MPDDQTGSILVHLVDGTRQPLPSAAKWSARIHDGRSPSEWTMLDVDGSGPAELVKGLRYFDNFFDNYTVIARAKGCDDAGWTPIHISPMKPVSVDLMLLPKRGEPDFAGANWDAVTRFRPRFAEILSMGGKGDPSTRYNKLTQQSPLVAACLLNLLTAMDQITLSSRKSPLDYYWEPIWNDPQFKMAQDRFYAYVDAKLVNDVVESARMGAFSEEKNPGTWHPGATLSYKQTQFDVTNVQFTFHQGNTKTLQGPNGPVDCVVVEPDIDYYKDLLGHSLLEVLPNTFTKGLTDPRGVCLLRWMACKQAGLDFNPLFTIIAS